MNQLTTKKDVAYGIKQKEKMTVRREGNFGVFFSAHANRNNVKNTPFKTN
jgi:hypothetical protein